MWLSAGGRDLAVAMARWEMMERGSGWEGEWEMMDLDVDEEWGGVGDGGVGEGAEDGGGGGEPMDLD